jgi:putative transposase
VFTAFFASLALSFLSRAALQLEILALRHQLGVLQRSVKRPKLTSSDRLLWVWLCRIWPGWRSALIIVQPDTVIAWHRNGFRLFWKLKGGCGRPGRPSVPQDVRELIRRLNRENPLWGAPRIHGELLKLGIDIGETSVGKYMGRRRTPPSQTWRTFLDNHLTTLVSVDFFTVPTITRVERISDCTRTPRSHDQCKALKSVGSSRSQKLAACTIATSAERPEGACVAHGRVG